MTNSSLNDINVGNDLSFNAHDLILEGKYIRLREANVEDSQFILSLRTDKEKARYIHQTSSDVNLQIEYMKAYKKKKDDWYFIVENKKYQKIGTIGVYPYPILTDKWKSKNNPNEGILGTGRWLMSGLSTSIESIESDLLVKRFFFDLLCQSNCPLMIHKNNSTVIDFQKKWGIKEIGFEDKIDHYLFELSIEEYRKNLSKFKSFIYR